MVVHQYVHCREVREAAKGNFCKFHRLEVREFDQMMDALDFQIGDSALGTAGWAFTRVRDWAELDFEQGHSDARGSCVSFKT